jgi:tetratricopeptide (TPR) repeat protein
MDRNLAQGKPLALEPIEDAARGADGAVLDDKDPGGKGKHELHLTTTDEFLTAAAKEYEAGEVDAALWRRAGEQSRGDASLVIAAYLRARATALKLEHKEHARSHRRARPEPAGSQRKVASEPSSGNAPAPSAGAPRPGISPAVKYAAAGVAALVAVGAVVWLIASPRGSESVEAPARAAAVSAPVSAPGRSAPATPPAKAGSAAGATSLSGPDVAALEGKVRELKNTGNWNMLVIYAADWARKEPKNVQAWRELSAGYVNLRQFADALDAANGAVQAVPENASLWSDLGQVNLTIARLPEAGKAFDRALALDPEDTNALCGAAAVAQKQGRPDDAEALSRRVRSDDGCRATNAMADTASAAAGTEIRRPVPSARR